MYSCIVVRSSCGGSVKAELLCDVQCVFLAQLQAECYEQKYDDGAENAREQNL